MMRPPILLLTLAVLACGGRTPPPETANQEAAADSTEDPSAEAELPPMPSVPAGREGQLAVRAVGAFDLDRVWPARAGRCARPAMVLVLAEEPGSGISVLLQLPGEGDLTGEYPVKLADSAGVPSGPASQLGVQFFEAGSAQAYQAAEGAVDVRDLTERRITGRFTVTVRHLATNARARVAGSFQQVDVEALPPDWCDRAAAAQDSLAKADSAGGP